MKTYELNNEQCTISSIIQVVKDTFGYDTNFWFRGQADHNHNLLPSIFRQGESFGGCKMDEAAMIREFKQNYPTQRNQHQDDNEWLSLMQHYGLPTRILDWSTSALVGSYFAVDQLNNPKNAYEYKDGALYVLDPKALLKPKQYVFELQYKPIISKRTFWEVLTFLVEQVNIFTAFEVNQDKDITYQILIHTKNGQTIESDMFYAQTLQKHPTLTFFNQDIPNQTLTHITLKTRKLAKASHKKHIENANYLVKSTIDILCGSHALQLAHLNDRIKAQHGVFTWHGGKYIDGVEVLPYKAPEELWKDDLLKIQIPAAGKQKLLQELAYAGIDKASLFPDMEHVAKSIREKYTCWPDS